jgi:hypothetical protein
MFRTGFRRNSLQCRKALRQIAARQFVIFSILDIVVKIARFKNDFWREGLQNSIYVLVIKQ